MIFLTKKKPKKRKKKLRIKKVIYTLLLLALGGIIFSFGFTVYENIRVQHLIQSFKDRAVFESEVEFESRSGIFQTRRYYKVSRETNYELNDDRSVFYDQSRRFLGQKGDIFATHQSPFPQVRGVHEFISYYYGGHAAINDGENRFIEAIGFPDEDESLLEIMLFRGNKPHDFSTTIGRNSTNYWLLKGYTKPTDTQYPYYGDYYRNHFIGLRVKDITAEQIDGAVDYAFDKYENKAVYNFLFFLNMKYKYYCTDLISRAYQHVMVEENKQRSYSRALNDDGFITSVNDLILSRETYITFYVEIIDEILHIYYLEDIN